MSVVSDAFHEADYCAYVGRTRRNADVIDLNRACALHATLGAKGPEPIEGDALAPLAHWLYFWEIEAAQKLASDGHPRRGEFLPPALPPHRMWAGSRVEFLRPLPIGRSAWRDAVILNIQAKNGHSGRLVIVTVRYAIGADDATCIVDEHDIVFRDSTPIKIDVKLARDSDPPSEALVERTVKADTVTLFRYSALTFNGHRIHYDRDYAMRDEHYPGLVVHGPLLATYMVNVALEARAGGKLRSFSFRARSPIFDTDTFQVGARQSAASPNALDVWIADPRGRTAFSGTALFE